MASLSSLETHWDESSAEEGLRACRVLVRGDMVLKGEGLKGEEEWEEEEEEEEELAAAAPLLLVTSPCSLTTTRVRCPARSGGGLRGLPTGLLKPPPLIGLPFPVALLAITPPNLGLAFVPPRKMRIAAGLPPLAAAAVAAAAAPSPPPLPEDGVGASIVVGVRSSLSLLPGSCTSVPGVSALPSPPSSSRPLLPLPSPSGCFSWSSPCFAWTSSSCFFMIALPAFLPSLLPSAAAGTSGTSGSGLVGACFGGLESKSSNSGIGPGNRLTSKSGLKILSLWSLEAVRSLFAGAAAAAQVSSALWSPSCSSSSCISWWRSCSNCSTTTGATAGAGAVTGATSATGAVSLLLGAGLSLSFFSSAFFSCSSSSPPLLMPSSLLLSSSMS